MEVGMVKECSKENGEMVFPSFLLVMAILCVLCTRKRYLISVSFLRGFLIRSVVVYDIELYVVVIVNNSSFDTCRFEVLPHGRNGIIVPIEICFCGNYLYLAKLIKHHHYDMH
jgi:hypothetical protein